LTDFYLFFNFGISGTTLDFSNSGWTGTITQVGKSSTFNAYNASTKTVSSSGSAAGNATDGTVLYFSGGVLAAGSNFDFTISNNNQSTMGFAFGAAVPEPGTLLLGGIAAACGGTGVWFKRRKKAPADQPAEEPTA
jgi:hypothetical protein